MPVIDSKISWTDSTWSTVTGCTKVSPGCDHCYAETIAEKWRGKPGHPYEQGFDLRLWPSRLEQPLHWKAPRRIFVNSMGDWLHVGVPDEFVEQMLEIMRRTPWHTYQALTKRAERLERISHRLEFPDNLWAGVSVESPAYYSRIRHLQRSRAAVRFLSCEPLLAPLPALPLDGIHWVIAGGESGLHLKLPENRQRWMDHAWARELRDQCVDAGVAYFFKQSSGLRTEMGTMLEEEDGTRSLIQQFPRELTGARQAVLL